MSKKISIEFLGDNSAEQYLYRVNPLGIMFYVDKDTGEVACQFHEESLITGMIE